MDLCQIIYFLCVLIYSVLYYLEYSYMNVQDYQFTWPRLVFLWSVLLLLDKYDLVPSPLRCPPLYMTYKVVAAIVIANSSMILLWFQLEDMLNWAMNKVLSLAPYVGMEKKEYGKGDDPQLVLELTVTIFLFLWVLVSTGILPQMKGRNSSANLKSTSCGRRRRSKARC